METQRSKTNVESAESPTHSPPNTTPLVQTQSNSDIPIEIVSEEEMALIDSALALATTRSATRSIHSITVLSKRGLFNCSTDIEDHGGKNTNIQHQKRFRVNESLLYRFRRKRGLFVTDITASVGTMFLFTLDFMCVFVCLRYEIVELYFFFLKKNYK